VEFVGHRLEIALHVECVAVAAGDATCGHGQTLPLLPRLCDSRCSGSEHDARPNLRLPSRLPRTAERPRRR
jgi:hypothetical protein